MSNGNIPLLNVDVWEHAYLSEIQKSQKSLCHQLVPSDRLEGCMAESPGKHELNYKRRISRQDTFSLRSENFIRF